MKKKYKKINLVFSIIPVMVVLLLLVAGSYAIFSTDLNPVKIHTLTIGDLYAAKLSVTDNGYVNLTNAVPLSNDLGMKGEATSLTLENVGDLTATYSIVLLDDKTSYSEYDGSVLPDTVIKYGLTKNNNAGRTISLLSNATEYCSDAEIETYALCQESSTAESGRVIMTGKLAVGEKVDYKLRLWINYIAGNAYQENRYYGQIKVIINKDLGIDINRPYIVLNGDNEVNLNLGQNYYEEGILAALDKEDGDVSNTLLISGNVDVTTPGVYHVNYSVYDSMGQYGFATRTVIVNNQTECGITFTVNGSNPYTHLLGTTYSDLGATAVDSSDNNLIVTTNSLGLDVDTMGQYHIIYSATTGGCTDYAYRLVEVSMGAGGYITYTPNGTDNMWSSSNVTTIIEPSSDIVGITPQSFRYKIGTYVGNNIVYGAEVSDSNLSASYTFSSSGKYVISVTLVGTTGIELRNLLSGIFLIDKTAPSCGVPTYTATPPIGSTPAWLNASRTVSVTSCQDNHSGCDGASLSRTFDNTLLAGEITIADRATPNPNTAVCSVGVYIDKTPPECGTITNANTTWTKTLSNPISVACSDIGSGCTSNSYSSSFVGHTGTTGIIQIVDKSVQANTVNCTVNTYMDNSTPTVPTITGTTSSNVWATSNTLTMQYTGTSLSGITAIKYCESATNSSAGCSWNTASTYNATNKPTYSMSDVTYVFARAVNTVGTMGTISPAFIVKIDSAPPTAPTITGTTASNVWATSNTLTISGGSSQLGIASYKYCATSTNNASTCSTWSTYDPNNKPTYSSTTTKYIFARAISDAGTLGTISPVFIVKIDANIPLAPTITGTTASGSWSTNNTLTINPPGTLPVSGVASYKYCATTTNDASTCSTWSTYDSNNKPTYSSTITRYVFARIVNTIGTLGTISSAFNVRVDTTPPTCTFEKSGINFVVSGTDANSGMNSAPYSFTSETSGFSTTNTITANNTLVYNAWTKDAVGNTKQCSMTCGAWSCTDSQEMDVTCENAFISTDAKKTSCTDIYHCKKNSTCSTGTKESVGGTYYCVVRSMSGGPCSCTYSGSSTISRTCAQLNAPTSGITSCNSLCIDAGYSAGTGTSCRTVITTNSTLCSGSGWGNWSDNRNICYNWWKSDCSSVGGSIYRTGKTWQECTRECN